MASNQSPEARADFTRRILAAIRDPLAFHRKEYEIEMNSNLRFKVVEKPKAIDQPIADKMGLGYHQILDTRANFVFRKPNKVGAQGAIGNMQPHMVKQGGRTDVR